MDLNKAVEHCWDRRDYPEVISDDAGLDISIPRFITRGPWREHNRPRRITLNVTTYIGTSWNAVHYYGNLDIEGISFSQEDSPARSKTSLMRRTPVIIRLDGKAFHTFTKGFVKPFDECMSKAMQETMKYLCENIQGCVLGYTQSDEITLVLIDYQKLTTDAWFDYEVQKICSVAASMATFIFNRQFQVQVNELSWKGELADENLAKSYIRAIKSGAVFDALISPRKR